MKQIMTIALTALTLSASAVAAASDDILRQLATIEDLDFEVSGILRTSTEFSQVYELSVPSLGTLPVVIDGGRELRRTVEDRCNSAQGCDATVVGRLEFEPPIIIFSISSAASIEARHEATNEPDVLPCWNAQILSSKDQREQMTISVDFLNGLPQSDSVQFLSGSKSEAEISGFFEAARRAIIRCGGKGNSLANGTHQFTFNMNGVALQ